MIIRAVIWRLLGSDDEFTYLIEAEYCRLIYFLCNIFKYINSHICFFILKENNKLVECDLVTCFRHLFIIYTAISGKYNPCFMYKIYWYPASCEERSVIDTGSNFLEIKEKIIWPCIFQRQIFCIIVVKLKSSLW